MLNLPKNEKAVSEVLGTILILGIAVAIFSTLYIIVLSEPFDSSEPYPTIVAFVEGDNIIIEHRGGDEIDVGSAFKFTLGDITTDIPINESVDTNSDGKWGIGERLTIPLTDVNGGSNPYDPNNHDVDILGPQEVENGETSIFSGNLDIHPTSDIGIKCTVSDETPRIGDIITITITVTHYNGDMVIPAGLNINFILPDGLEHISNNTNSGKYNNNTGNWILDELSIRGSATLSITAEVKGRSSEQTQLVLILDGSGSIDDGEWDIMTGGLANAIRGGYIPHDGTVEFSIVQFGGYESWFSAPFAEVVTSPVILDDDNYNGIANTVQNMAQFKGWTPLACGLKRCARLLATDPDFDIKKDYRQVINLVTDGVPNCDWNSGDNDIFIGSHVGETYGKIYSVNARNYLLNKLVLDQEQDELDALAVGIEDSDVDWLRDNIVWPEPGYDNWPPIGPGWVRKINTFDDFSQAINEQFELIFSDMNIQANMVPSSPIDITVKVNNDITIQPED